MNKWELKGNTSPNTVNQQHFNITTGEQDTTNNNPRNTLDLLQELVNISQ